MATKKIEIQDSSGNIYYPHTDVSVVNNMPTTMKNPNALTISLNGTSQGAYDGSAAKSIDITPSGIGAAASNHGTHVPTPQTANNKKFLRNDNTWQDVTPGNIGAYTKSEIDTKVSNINASLNENTQNINTLMNPTEGTFTPTIGGLTTEGASIYSKQSGLYKLNNKRLTFEINLTLSALASNIDGFLIIRNLPYACSRAISVSLCRIYPCTQTAQITPYIDTNKIYLYLVNSLYSQSALEKADISNETVIRIIGEYYI